MLRTFVWLCSLILVALLGRSAAAFDWNDVPARRAAVSRDFAMLTLSIDPSGTARISFSWVSTKPRPGVAEILQALQGSLDGSTEIVEPVQQLDADEPDEREPDLHRSFRNQGTFQRHGLVVRGQMDPAPLMKLLRDRGIASLSLYVQHPHAGFSDSIPHQDSEPVLSENRRRALRVIGMAIPKGLFPDTRQYDFAVDEPAPRFELQFGYGSETLLPLASLLALIVLPPIGTFWLRQRALRASVQDPAAALFSFDRFVGWLYLIALFGWIMAVSVFHVDERLREIYQFLCGRPYLGPVRSNPFGILPIGLILVPNAIVWLWCLSLSYPVFKRLRGVEWTRRQMLAQAFWRQASMVLPILFGCCALGALSARDFRLVVVWCIAAYVSRVLGVRLRTSSKESKPILLDVGPLRDRIFELAKKAGVAIRQIYLIPSSKDRHANAAAIQGNKMVLFDYLVRNMSRREVDAVVAHELAHLRHRHPGKAGWFVKVVLVLFGGSLIFLDIAPFWFRTSLARRPWLADVLYFAWEDRVLVWTVFVALLLAAVRFRQRRWELLADRDAADLTGDPGAMLAALVKLARLNLHPMDWGKWQGRLLPHPSHSRRLQSLAERGGLSRERLDELVKLPDDGSGAYELPQADAAQERVYSPSFKQRRAFINSWLLLLTLTLTPALAWLAVQSFDWRGPVRLLALVGGFLATCFAYAWVNSRLSVRGEPGLCRRLREKQENEQLSPDDLDAVCVAFSPSPMMKLYEQSYDWDAGCLYLTSGLLCYLGEQTRFALRPEQVADIRLGQGPPRWTRSRRVFVTWRDAGQAREGVFNLRPFGPRSLHQGHREAVRLYERLQTWLKDPAQFPASQKSLLQLTAPQLGEITGTALHEANLAKRLFKTLVLICVVAVGVSLLFSPFSNLQSLLQGWYVVGTSTLTWLLFFLPTLWRGRQSRANARRTS